MDHSSIQIALSDTTTPTTPTTPIHKHINNYMYKLTSALPFRMNVSETPSNGCPKLNMPPVEWSPPMLRVRSRPSVTSASMSSSVSANSLLLLRAGSEAEAEKEEEKEEDAEEKPLRPPTLPPPLLLKAAEQRKRSLLVTCTIVLLRSQ
jgi:hypothetical protein